MISTGRDVYMTVWSLKQADSGNYIEGQVSTSRKNKSDDTYVNSNWRVRFVGQANEKAKGLSPRERIIVKPGDLTIEHIYLKADEEKGLQAKDFYTVTVFNFEGANSDSKQTDSDELPI